MALTTTSFSPPPPQPPPPAADHCPLGGGGSTELLTTVLMTDDNDDKEDEVFCPFSGLVQDLVQDLSSPSQSPQVSTDQFCYFLCRVFESLGEHPYLQGSLLKLLSAAQATPLAGELDHCGRCVLKSAALRHAGLHVLEWLQARGLLDVHVIDNRGENAIFEVLRRGGRSPGEN
ncbi:hypothetical protein ACOMHN_021328 [Nucella lapillus]